MCEIILSRRGIVAFGTLLHPAAGFCGGASVSYDNSSSSSSGCSETEDTYGNSNGALADNNEGLNLMNEANVALTAESMFAKKAITSGVKDLVPSNNSSVIRTVTHNEDGSTTTTTTTHSEKHFHRSETHSTSKVVFHKTVTDADGKKTTYTSSEPFSTPQPVEWFDHPSDSHHARSHSSSQSSSKSYYAEHSSSSSTPVKTSRSDNSSARRLLALQIPSWRDPPSLPSPPSPCSSSSSKSSNRFDRNCEDSSDEHHSSSKSDRMSSSKGRSGPSDDAPWKRPAAGNRFGSPFGKDRPDDNNESSSRSSNKNTKSSNSSSSSKTQGFRPSGNSPWSFPGKRIYSADSADDDRSDRDKGRSSTLSSRKTLTRQDSWDDEEEEASARKTQLSKSKSSESSKDKGSRYDSPATGGACVRFLGGVPQVPAPKSATTPKAPSIPASVSRQPSAPPPAVSTPPQLPSGSPPKRQLPTNGTPQSNKPEGSSGSPSSDSLSDLLMSALKKRSERGGVGLLEKKKNTGGSSTSYSAEKIESKRESEEDVVDDNMSVQQIRQRMQSKASRNEGSMKQPNFERPLQPRAEATVWTGNYPYRSLPVSCTKQQQQTAGPTDNDDAVRDGEQRQTAAAAAAIGSPSSSSSKQRPSVAPPPRPSPSQPSAPLLPPRNEDHQAGTGGSSRSSGGVPVAPPLNLPIFKPKWGGVKK